LANPDDLVGVKPASCNAGCGKDQDFLFHVGVLRI